MSRLQIIYRVSLVLWGAAVVTILVWPIPKVGVLEPSTQVMIPPPMQGKTEITTAPKAEPPISTERPSVREDIPLDAETQRLLHQACEETGGPFELALAVIWQETNFQNVVGDGGDSIGYMQVQPRWHGERMERLGVTDLADPYGNFLVGCDYLAEMMGKNRGLEWALMAYNGGPTYANNMAKAGKTSQYARDVLKYLENLGGN